MADADQDIVVGAYTEKRGEVGWIIMRDYDATSNASLTAKRYVHIGAAVGQALHDFRYDPEVRVIVLTGENDGEFYRVARGSSYDDPGNRKRLNPIINIRGIKGMASMSNSSPSSFSTGNKIPALVGVESSSTTSLLPVALSSSIKNFALKAI